MRDELGEIARAAAPLPRRRVLLVVGRDPLFVAGPGSHLDELIALTGGTNVAHDALTPYAAISLESALARLPEVIIDTSDNRSGAPRGAVVAGWGEWQFLPAVREARVYWLDPQQLAIPGMRLPQMARLTARLIHPENFGPPGADDFEPAAAAGEPRATSE
jgi:iron complex transport system substrate-binding protein